MFNGFTNQIRKGLAGFIMACLITATTSPLLINITAKTTPKAKYRVLPYQRVKIPKRAVHTETQLVETQDFSASEVKVSQVATDQTDKSRDRSVDLYLLARVIHAEGRGEPFKGQVAIGAVLLNRLRDPRFPKSLQQIIFKQGEFCTVRDGQIWLQPSDESIRAAKLAVQGWDPTGGALYFYNPAKTTSKWIWGRPVTQRIGQHVFAV